MQRRATLRDGVVSILGESARVARTFIMAVGLLGLALAVGSLLVGSTATSHRRHAPPDRTALSLSRIYSAIRSWEVQHGRFPPHGSIGELEEHIGPLLKRMNEGANFRVNFDEHGHVVDGWGRRFRLMPAVGATESLTIYSVGPNGEDEGGRGDDIVRGVAVVQ